MHIRRTATIAAREQEAPPELKEFISKLARMGPAELVSQSSELLEWNGPRIDLFQFVPVLDHFDDLLAALVAKYNLETAVALLSPEDSQFAVTLLELSRVFIERGSNRGIYSSIPHVSALLRCANSVVVTAALNLISKLLGLRYAEVKPESRPAPLRNLSADLLQIFVQEQPQVVEYIKDNQTHQFVVNKSLSLADQVAAIPQGISETIMIVTMLRSAYDGDEFEISQFYAGAVATLIEDPNLYINSHIIDQILPASTATLRFKRTAYDCLRDMCFSHSQLMDRKHQLAVPFGNMHLISQLSNYILEMEQGTLDIDTTIAFFKLLTQVRMGISITCRPLLNFIRNGSSPKYITVQTAAMMAFYNLLMEKQSNIDEFIESQGVDTLIETLHHEVSLDLEADQKPSLIKVDYSLSYTRVQWFKSLVVILSNVLKRKSSRSIVARLLNTPILDVLVTIISKVHTFGWLIVSMCIQILSILLKEEESIITLLMENYNGKDLVLSLLNWTTNPYYFSPMFHFTAALLSSERGKEVVLENKILDKLFDSLASSSLSSYGSLNAVGHGLEEINSECPDLQEHVTKLVIKFIATVNENMVAVPPWVGTDGTDEYEPPKASVVLLNIMFMLDSIFSNHHIMVIFLKQRGLDPLLDLMCNPAMPFDLILSKEMYKPDHAFSHTMQLLFSIEADTDYILDTIYFRLKQTAKAFNGFRGNIDDKTPESLEFLANISRYNILTHAYNAMVFSGTSYHSGLAAASLLSPKHDGFIEEVVEAYKIAVSEHATLVTKMPRDDLVASWPVAACFNIKHSPEDLEIINKSKPLVSSDFLYYNYARCTLSLCYYRIGAVVAAISGDLNKESTLHRAEPQAYMLSEKISNGMISVLQMPPNCRVPPLYYRDVGEMCAILLTGAQRFNSSIFVFFKQSHGIQRLFEVQKVIMDSPEPPQPIRLYLNPNVSPKYFTVFAQMPYFALFRFILYESEVLSRSQIASDLMTGFNLQQFYVEARILVLTGLAGLAAQVSQLKPRSFISFCDAIKLAVKPVKGTLPPQDRDHLPRRFDWRLIRDPTAKLQALLDIGVSEDDAKGQMASCQNNLAEAVYRLRKSKYPDLPELPVVMYPVGDEMPVVDGKMIVTLEDLNAYSEHLIEDKILPALVGEADRDAYFPYFIASPLAHISGIADTLGKNVRPNIKLISIMMRDADFFAKIHPLVVKCDLRDLVMEMDPYAITVMEQLLSKANTNAKNAKVSVDEVELKFYRDDYAAPVWSESDSERFVSTLSNSSDLTALQLATAVRFMLLLCSKSPLLSRQIVESEYLWKLTKLMSSPELTANTAYLNRVSVCLYMLIPILVESEHTLSNYIIKYLDSRAQESNFFDISDHIHTWNGFLFRCPVLFLGILNKLAVTPEEGSKVLITNVALQKYATKLLETLNDETEAAKYSLNLPEAPNLQASSLELGQKQVVQGIIKALISCSDEYNRLAVNISGSEEDLVAFKRSAHQVQFYLAVLRILLGFNSSVATLLLNYPELELNDKKTVVLNILVRNLLAIPNTDRRILKIEQQVSEAAGQIIALLTSFPADTGYTTETVASYTERVRILVGSICKILVNEFLAVKAGKFREKLLWRYSLLQNLLGIFNREIMPTRDANLQRFAKVPILESVIVDKKLVQIVGLCLSKVDCSPSEDGSDHLRGAINQFLEWINAFENHDYNTLQLGVDEETSGLSDEDGDDSQDDGEGHDIIIEMGSGSELESDSDLDLEIQYSDYNNTHHDSRNIFRNSTLGMYEHQSDEDHSDEPQEYDHISDDEVLSDMDDEEDDDDDVDLLDAEFDGYEEDFAEDIDAELDLSDDDNNSDNDHGSVHSGMAPDYHGDHFEAIGDLGESDDDIFMNNGTYRSDGDDDVVHSARIIHSNTPLRRFSETTAQRPVVLSNSESHWLQAPIWLMPQQVVVENSIGVEATSKELDSDGIYIPGVDLPDLSARSIGSPLNIVGKLATPQAMFAQLNHMFCSPQHFNTTQVVETIGQVSWAESREVVEQVEQIKALVGPTDVGSARVSDNDSLHDSDYPSIENFEVNIQGTDEPGDVPVEEMAEEHSDLEEPMQPVEPEEPTGPVESTPSAGESREATAEPTQETTPYFIDVGGRRVDVAELGIDPLFLEALPDDIRQEFLQSYLSDHNQESDDYDSEFEEAANVGSGHGYAHPQVILDPIFGQLTGFRNHHGHFSEDDSSSNELLDSVSHEVARPSLVFATCADKPRSGIHEWSSSIDERVLASILRQFYMAQDPEMIDSTATLFIRLSTNRLHRDRILQGLLSIFEYICTGKSHEGLARISQTILEGDVTGFKFRPAQCVQPPYENVCDLVGQVGDVLVQLLTALLVDSDEDHGIDALSLLLQLLKLFESRVVYSNPRVLDCVAELCALVSGAYTRMAEVQAMSDSDDDDENSDWESVDEEDDAADADTTAAAASDDGSSVHNFSQIIADTSPPAPQNALPVAEETLGGISEHIGRLISALSSDECSSSAFRDILQVLSDVHNLPGIYDAIKSKVLRDGRKFRQRVFVDLKALHSGDQTKLDLEVLGKFASGAAAQTKLLRITTFVDYLMDTRKVEDLEERRNIYTELISLFKGINLYPAWMELSKCLKLIEETDYRYSTALLPLIECITVISKRVLNAEKENSYSGWLRTKFIEFSLEHRKILNHLVRMNPKLLSGSFAVLSKDSRVLDFDNKLKYFNRRAMEEKDKLGSRLTRLSVRRDQVFLDTYRALFFKKPEEIKSADIQVTFKDEEGVDAGGVTREWYETLSKQIFNPDYVLFLPTSTGSNIFQPNPASYVNPEHLSFFKFIGKIIGKAVYDGRVMSCYFSRPLYKCLLQRPITVSDMEAVDEEYYKSLLWMLENDITDVFNETFSVDEDKFGETTTVDLIENGSEIPVTEDNKAEYVRLLVQYKLVDSIAPQIEAIVQGFNDMIPEKIRPVFFELFDEREIELLICGLPDIDIEDWRDNTSYQSYSAQSVQIKWFWTVVASFDNEQRAKLLQYATGTSKVPVGGFANLETSNNAPKFSIVRDFGDSGRLPSAHTCTNQIDLPLYENYQQLRNALLKAITEGSSGFGLA